MLELRKAKTAMSASQLRLLAFPESEQSHNLSRRVHGILRRLEVLGYVERELVPVLERRAAGDGGSSWLFRITSAGTDALEREGL